MSDIVVIGAGAVGCLTALEMRRRGATVTLAERGTLGAEASWAGGGILFPLLPWHYCDEVNQLALAGAAHYAKLAINLHDTTGMDTEYWVSGMHVLTSVDVEQAMDWCANNSVKAEPSAQGIFLPEVAQIRNPRLLKALRQQLKIEGVILRESAEICACTITKQKVTAMQTASGEKLLADNFIITAGAWSKSLLGEQTAMLDITPIRGQMLLYRLSTKHLKQIIYQDDFYLIPRQDGHVLAGSTIENVGFDKKTTQQAAFDLHKKAVSLLPALHKKTAIKQWAGLRPGSPKNIPIIGPHPELENLWLNTGHFRYGVTMAPSSAEKLAKLMA